MVQLNTTYDSSIKKKIFVLKGDEGYARTTDVIASLITDFDDYTSFINNCHVGLEIQVLREIGESTLYIYVDDEIVHAIPWKDSGMAQIIDEDWNAKGVYWVDGKLIIGKYEDDPYENTGLYLLYDVEHTIKVQYIGNKRCLGSHETLTFSVPTPDTFATELSLASGHTHSSYELASDVDDITLLLECGQTLTDAKSVKIYDDDTLLTTVSATQDTLLTLDLTSYELSDGLHTIRAEYGGDAESYGSRTELEIGIGYKLSNLSYPSYILSGGTGKVSFRLQDHFGHNISGGTVRIGRYVNDSFYTLEYVTAGSTGLVKFNSVHFTGDSWGIKYGNWYSERYDTEIVSINSITIEDTNPKETVKAITNGVSVTHKGTIDVQVANVPITISYTKPSGDVTTINAKTNANGEVTHTYTGTGSGTTPMVMSVNNTEVSATKTIHDAIYFWDYLRYSNSQFFSSTANIEKIWNGYTIKGGGTAPYVRFGYEVQNKEHTIEFDVLDYSGTASTYGLRFMGVFITSFSESLTNNTHVKIVHNPSEESVTVYYGSTKVYEGTSVNDYFSESAFRIQLINCNLTVNNLIIERTGQ